MLFITGYSEISQFRSGHDAVNAAFEHIIIVQVDILVHDEKSNNM
jgi:hypothetical protein